MSNAPYSHNIDRQALLAYVEAISDILEKPFVTVFVQVDSSGAFFHYAYRALQFHDRELQTASGERELFFYLHPNRDNDGVWRMNVALLPRSRTAFDGYRRWLLPQYHQAMQANQTDATHKKGLGEVQSNSGLMCFTTVETTPLGENWWDGFIVEEVTRCYPADHNELDNSDHGGGGNTDPCWSCDGDSTDIGNGGGVPIPTGCEGDPNAFTDHCGRCVGGNTGRRAAKSGDDCNNLNIPCAGDMIKNPEITSPGASGKTGGRFRPCVESVSPGGASGGWQGPNCTDEDLAVRNNGLDAHHGLDLTCNVGDPIYAPFDLDNVNTGFLQGVGYGNYLRGWTMIDGTRYNFGVAHLQNRPPVPTDGKFKQGDIIGYCGRSGITRESVTTHVHVEMGTESTFSSTSRVFLVNPEPFLLTQFSTDSTATPVNPDPCNQN